MPDRDRDAWNTDRHGRRPGFGHCLPELAATAAVSLASQSEPTIILVYDSATLVGGEGPALRDR